MKKIRLLFITLIVFTFSCNSKMKKDTGTLSGEPTDVSKNKYLFLDVHNLKPGSVSAAAVAEVHLKDLATQGKFGVSFIKYWVDEKLGKVYCLAESPDSASVYQTHKEAHGLVPDFIHQVDHGDEAKINDQSDLFLDVHNLGAGNVTAEAVADAHKKDLAAQSKHHVNFINYWVNEKSGVVMCLSEAPDSAAISNTHKEAHGLLPNEVHKVSQGE